MQVGETIWVRSHQILRLERDLVVFVIVGEVQESDVDGILQWERQLRDEVGYTLVLVDANRMGVMPAEVRKRAAAALQADQTYCGALAIWGAPFLVRTLINLLLRATALLTRQPAQPTEYFAHRADAIAWLHTQRGPLQKQGATIHSV